MSTDVNAEIQYKISNVTPIDCIQDVKNIKKPRGKWTTLESDIVIELEFQQAILSKIVLKNNGCDYIQAIFQDNSNQDFIPLISKDNPLWKEDQIVQYSFIQPPVLSTLTLIVQNIPQNKPKGFRNLQLFGIQENTEKLKIPKKNQLKSDTQKEQFHELNQNLILKPSQDKWKLYKSKAPQLEYQDARQNLHSQLRKSSDSVPIPEAIIIEDAINDRIASDIDDDTMIKFKFNQFNQDFIILHTQLQQSSNIGRNLKFTESNLDKIWNNK